MPAWTKLFYDQTRPGRVTMHSRRTFTTPFGSSFPSFCETNLFSRKSGPGMYTSINLPPGTHHLKFVVDGEMMTSQDLPTAVDFNNFLVNYVEIATDDQTTSRRESNQPSIKAAIHAAHPTLALPDHDQGRSGDVTPDESDIEPQAVEIPPGDFRQIIPQALLDIDLPDDDPRYHQAVRIISDGIGPPSLPLFLGRSILNGNLPVKDDNSVLTLPNHTVLNHLMTSSVKNGVLATSVTIRYRKKVLFLPPHNCSFCVELTCDST